MDKCLANVTNASPERQPRQASALSSDWQEMQKKSTFGLTPAQLGRLLAVSARAADSADAMAEDQAREMLLQEYLSRRLSEEPLLAKILLQQTCRPVAEIQLLLERTMKATLLDPRCDLAFLQAIKDHNKRLSAMIASGPQTLMTATLYYAAVAAALVYHNQRISRYTIENLAERFSALTQRSWIDGELRDLFLHAAAVCRRAGPGRQ